MLDSTLSPDDLERDRSALLALLIRMGFSYAVAQDAVQTAMLKDLEWLSSGRASTIKTRPAWLRTVAIRAAQYDKRRRRRERSLEAGKEPSILPFPVFDQEEEDRYRLDAILAALEMLSEELRTVLLMHTIEGRSIQKIADELSLKFWKVNHLLRRARHIVRDQLRAAGYELPDSA